MKQRLLKTYYKNIWKLARFYISKKKPIVIWITGSVWKTSCRMILFQTLKQLLPNKNIYTSGKNFNGELWITLSIFQFKNYNPWVLSLIKNFFVILFKSILTKPKYDIILLEYWIDYLWEMDFMLNITKPDFAIVTKIDKVHSHNLWSPDITAQEKYKLGYAAKQAVFINYDDEYWKTFNEVQVDKFLYNTTGAKSTDIDFENYELTKDQETISSSFDLIIKDQQSKIKTNLTGKENAWYIWIWIVIADILKYLLEKESIVDQQKHFEFNFSLQPGRFNFLKWLYGNIIIDSSYNAAPASVNSAINNTINIREKHFSEYKLIFVLWDMRELGKFAEKEHRKIAWILSSADKIFLLWENTQKFTYDELIKIWFNSEDVFVFGQNWYHELWKALKDYLTENSAQKHIILFKWSQNTIFLEESIKYVLENQEDVRYLPRQENFWKSKK